MAFDALNAQTPRAVFIGSSTRGPFVFQDSSGNPIRVRTQSHLVVRRYVTTADETGTPLVLNTDFTVDNADIDDVEITLTSAQDVLASTERLVIYRISSIADVLSLSQGGDFSGPTLSDAIKILAEQMQDLRRDADRKIEASALDAAPPSFPLKGNANAGDLLAFDVDKNLQPVTPTDVSVTALMLGSGWSGLLASDASGVLDNLAGIRFVSTYAALTALGADTGLADNAIYCTYGRAAEEDGGFGFWRYDSGSSATANGGTILAINGGGNGRFFRLYRRGYVEAVWFGITQGSTAGSVPTNNLAAIVAAMARCDADGGGKAILPPTATSYIAYNGEIDNFYDNVLLVGAGRIETHDIGAAKNGTFLYATSAGAHLIHRSLTNVSGRRQHGGGFSDFTVYSGGIATRALRVKTRNGGIYKIHIEDCEGNEAVLFDCLVTSTDIGEAGDNQLFELDVTLNLRNSAASLLCKGVVFEGASNANTSIAFRRISIVGTHGSAALVDFRNCDNVTVDVLRSISLSSGRPFIVRGVSVVNSTLTACTQIRNLTCNNAGYVEGTNDANVTTAALVRIDNLDLANSSPRPTGGTGAIIIVEDALGIKTGAGFGGLAVGESVVNALAARAAMSSSASIYSVNTSNSGNIQSNVTDVWATRVDGSGHLEDVRLAGTGARKIPSGMLLGTQALSAGQYPGTATNDNASAGYKGEYTEQDVPSGSAVSLTTGAAANIASISLTAGDWDVSGFFAIIPGTNPATDYRAGITTSSASMPLVFTLQRGSFTAGAASASVVPTVRILVAGTTTVYLVGRADFPNTCVGYGKIQARRAR